ncbi:amidoligase family protein [Pseudoponticoccus marisrubri]|uniref:Amidoligase enzyme n=1 Tax=Pseudoponticoccus marisrubri TaxID=1685382 RepID=A0A0W7WJD0_9RHOB|nr:amidoligase family protein [Pseudoponticoccus marisrubri]KUF10584.1 hypothetical protein AVJ23_11950 [Pseudoponticoccus marisrubri]
MTEPRSAAFRPLPHATTTTGDPRLCGVEIEFGGMTEIGAAEVTQRLLGGTIDETGPRHLILRDSEIGDVGIELDTALRKADMAVVNAGLDMARGLVPVEIISAPLDTDGMERLDALRDALRQAGATGSRDGVLLGFGIHLNPAVVAPDDPVTLSTILAYGLLEDWMRAHWDLDGTRRLLPFVDPWPRRLVDDLVAEAPEDLTALRRIYARHTHSRNHGLDLMPLFAHADPDGFAEDFPSPGKTSARPTFHFRLPDCRIDEPAWSLAEPWEMWRKVECAAGDKALMGCLRTAWRINRDKWMNGRSDWVRTVSEILEETAKEAGA